MPAGGGKDAYFFLEAIINFNHQFVSADARTFENGMTIPAFTTDGQQGVIAEDRRPRRAYTKEGAPSSRGQKTDGFLLSQE